MYDDPSSQSSGKGRTLAVTGISLIVLVALVLLYFFVLKKPATVSTAPSASNATPSSTITTSATSVTNSSSDTSSPAPSQTESTPTGVAVTVPSVVGSLLQEAMPQLQRLGFRDVAVTEVIDEKTADTTITAQNPVAGAPVPADGKIFLTVSRQSATQFLSAMTHVEGDAPSVGSVTMNGKDYVHSVYFSTSWLSTGDARSSQWDLGRHFRTFTALAGVADSSSNGEVVRMEVIGDGKILWANDMTLGVTKPVSVNVTGVLRLELRTTRTRTGSGDGALPAFGDAQLSGLPGEVPSTSPTTN